jgi:hypothetical protein
MTNPAPDFIRNDVILHNATAVRLIRHEHPFPGNQLRAAVLWGSSSEANHRIDREPVTDLEQATIVTSEAVAWDDENMHRPVLDIDFPAKLISSTTPGHFHLYLDKPIPWHRYVVLLRALAAAGIIEPGYADASINRGYSAVRLPWIRRED